MNVGFSNGAIGTIQASRAKAPGMLISHATASKDQ
jgi:hypothetical protein